MARTHQNGPKRRCFRFLLVIVAASLALPLSFSLAQYDYFPSRPITIVIPFTPGGSADVLMRLVGQKLSESVKQPVLLDNRPGGGGNVGALAVKLAPPDGYTLFMAHTGTAVNVTLYPNLKFDPIKDFQPITPLISFPSILVVPAASSAKTFAEFVARAKAQPGGLSYASQGVGSSGHLLGEMLARDAGVTMVHVPYRGVVPAITDLIAGRVDFLFSSPISAFAYLQDGRLRALGITGEARSPILADVATLAELGFPNLQLSTWFGIVGPAGIPAPIIKKLNEQFISAAHSAAVTQMVVSQAAEVFTATPEEFGAVMARDIVRLGKVVRESGAKGE
jgi:tripartite-type tricarboxylate transporter receptor subunit TctC